MATAVAANDTRQEIQRSWWLWLVWGIAIMIVGVLMIAHPVQTAISLTIFLGAYWFVTGIIDVVMAIWKRQGPWGWFLFTGIIGILAGLVLMANPVISLGIIVVLAYYIIAFLFIFSGIMRMIVGARQSGGVGYKWTWGTLLVGLILALLGGWMLINAGGADVPGSNFFSVVMPVAGILAVFAGIVAIVFAFQVRLSR